MTISISEAFSTFFSPRMNKTLILIYLAAYSLLMLPYMMYSYSRNLDYLLPGYILYVFAVLILPGVQIMTVNKLAKGEENTVPQLSELPQVLINGIKMTVWSVIIGFIMIFPAFIIFFFAGLLFFKSDYMPIAMAVGFILLISAVLLLTFLYMIPAYCLFAKTMKFTSLFKIKQICNFIKPRKNHYVSYLLKTIGISVVYFVLIAFLFFIFCICVYIANGLQTDTMPDKLLLPLYFLYMIACGLFGFAIYIPMTAQLINSATDEELIEEKNEVPQEIKEDDDDFLD